MVALEEIVGLSLTILLEAAVISIPGILIFVIGSGNWFLVLIAEAWIALSGIFAIVDRLTDWIEERLEIQKRFPKPQKSFEELHREEIERRAVEEAMEE